MKCKYFSSKNYARNLVNIKLNSEFRTVGLSFEAIDNFYFSRATNVKLIV